MIFPDQVHLVVVDAQTAFAQALAARLQAEADFDVVAVLPSVTHLEAAVGAVEVDVVLLGLADDPGGVGTTEVLDVVAALGRREASTRVVVMAASNDGTVVAQAIEAGVSGWVPKSVGVDRLIETVRGVHRHETWIPADVLTGALRVLVESQGRSEDRETMLARLTPRERDVLQCIVAGLSRNEIAARLYLSPNTVRTHVQHVLRKLGVHSALNAAAVARSLGLDGGNGSPSPHARFRVPSQPIRDGASPRWS